MMQAYGLKTHIWNNNLRSIFLLVMFPVLLLLLSFGLMLLWSGVTGSMTVEEGVYWAASSMPAAAPVALGISGAWFAVAFMGHNAMINMATRSRSLTQSQEPRAYRLLENLCISRGITMPKLRVMETPAMNAFASGLRDSNYTITLTRGLMERLDDEELEAVIAHELSHVMNRDVRTMVIAVIFVGIFSFFGEVIFRNMFRINLGRSDHHRRSGGGNAGALIMFAVVIVAVAYFLAILIRFSLSRKREYMADAGAVELTKNPDAMIRALEKISGNSVMQHVPADLREMAIENSRTGFSGMFATHPPIEKRIHALQQFAGGRIGTQSRPKRRVSDYDDPAITATREKLGRKNPWTR